MGTPYALDRALVADPGARAGAALLYLPETESTQDVARALLRLGAPAGTAVLADHQTAGRGTRGRTWQAGAGDGIHLSVLAPVPPKPEAVPWLTPAAAIAVAQALRGLTSVPPRLKWPNDVLLGGRKVAGVLTEIPGDAKLAIVGIGVNVHRAPADGTLYPATAVADWALDELRRDDLAAQILREVDHLLRRLERGRTDHIKEAWRMLLDTLGQRVAVTQDGTVIEGRAAAVDGVGALIVRRDDGGALRLAPGSAATIRPLADPGASPAPAAKEDRP